MQLINWNDVQFADWDIWNLETPEDKDENRLELIYGGENE